MSSDKVVYGYWVRLGKTGYAMAGVWNSEADAAMVMEGEMRPQLGVIAMVLPSDDKLPVTPIHKPGEAVFVLPVGDEEEGLF